MIYSNICVVSIKVLDITEYHLRSCFSFFVGGGGSMNISMKRIVILYDDILVILAIKILFKKLLA